MHQEIRRYLEDYLRGDERRDERRIRPGVPAELQAHLGECAECSKELGALEAQSRLLRSLRSPDVIEPRAGFYARVMQRIEAQPASMWAVLLDRRVGFRLAVASAAMVALLGTYLITTEPSGPEFGSAAVVLTDTPRDNAFQASMQQEDGPRQQQQRDATLVDLASYHE